jgi:hypothetical protein
MNSQTLNYLKQEKNKLKRYAEISANLTCSEFLNKPSMRFVKSHVLDSNFCKIFPGMNYVDEPGHDAVFNGEKISIKTEQCIFTKNQYTKDITMVNLNSSKKEYTDEQILTKMEETDFDYLLLIATVQKGIGFVAKGDITMRLVGSQLKAKIDQSKIVFVVDPDYDAEKIPVEEEKNRKLKEAHERFCNEIYNIFDDKKKKFWLNF